MSGTMFVQAVGTILAGALMPADAARWVWVCGAASFVVAAVVGYALAREGAATSLRARGRAPRLDP